MHMSVRDPLVTEIGEEGAQPKVEHGKKPWFRKKQGNVPRKEKYKAPMPGLENQVFWIGGANEAAEFVDVKKAIGCHVGITFKLWSNMAQVAIENLEKPINVEPADFATPSSPLPWLKFRLR